MTHGSVYLFFFERFMVFLVGIDSVMSVISFLFVLCWKHSTQAGCLVCVCVFVCVSGMHWFNLKLSPLAGTDGRRAFGLRAGMDERSGALFFWHVRFD